MLGGAFKVDKDARLILFWVFCYCCSFFLADFLNKVNLTILDNYNYSWLLTCILIRFKNIISFSNYSCPKMSFTLQLRLGLHSTK